MTSKRQGNNLSGTNPLDLVLLVLALLIVYVAMITIPIDSKYNDVYITASVKQPLIGDPQITSLFATAQPHTFLSVPAMGDILTSGTIVISAETPSKKTQKTLKGIYRSFEETTTLVLKKVPNGEGELTVNLYENNRLIATQKVNIE